MREGSIKGNLSNPDWIQTANKTIDLSAKISLILSTAISRPGISLISLLAKHIFPIKYLEKLFGPNTIFAVNPWHHRHLMSFTALAFAFPLLVRTLCTEMLSFYKNQQEEYSDRCKKGIITNAMLCYMTFFNVLTSRPVLHIENQLALKSF